MAEPTAPTLTVTLQLTTHPTQPTPSLHALTLARTSSIKDLKTRLSNEWDGKPAVEGIVCVLGGRVCRDSDVLGDMFPEVSRAAAVGLACGAGGFGCAGRGWSGSVGPGEPMWGCRQ